MVAAKPLIARLGRLDGSRESIETASFFMIQNQRDAEECTEIWADQIKLALDTRKLFYLYVANDVLQKARESNYSAQFARVMPNVLQTVFPQREYEVKLKVKKILNIWRERDVFSSGYLDYWELMAGLDDFGFVHSTEGASPDEDEIETAKLSADAGKGLRTVPPLLNPVIHELKNLESFGHHKRITKFNAESISTELFAYHKDFQHVFDRKINENVAVEVHKGLIALDEYGKANDSEIKARQKIIQSLQEFINEQESIIADNLAVSAEIFEKKFKLEETAKVILPKIYFSDVSESSKIALLSLGDRFEHKWRDFTVNGVEEKTMEMLNTPVDEFHL